MTGIAPKRFRVLMLLMACAAVATLVAVLSPGASRNVRSEPARDASASLAEGGDARAPRIAAQLRDHERDRAWATAAAGAGAAQNPSTEFDVEAHRRLREERRAEREQARAAWEQRKQEREQARRERILQQAGDDPELLERWERRFERRRLREQARAERAEQHEQGRKERVQRLREQSGDSSPPRKGPELGPPVLRADGTAHE